MAVLHAKGFMQVDDRYLAKSIIDSEFACHIASATSIAGHPAIVPVISGTAWITGTHQHTLDPTDPYPQGYRLADTWPQL
jgi:proline racemase